MRRVSWRGASGGRDGCFGAIYMDIQRAQESSRRRTGDLLIRTLTRRDAALGHWRQIRIRPYRERDNSYSTYDTTFEGFCR